LSVNQGHPSNSHRQLSTLPSRATLLHWFRSRRVGGQTDWATPANLGCPVEYGLRQCHVKSALCLPQWATCQL